MKRKLAVCLLVLGLLGWTRATEGAYRVGFAPGFDIDCGGGNNSLFWGLIGPEGKWNGEMQLEGPPGHDVGLIQPIPPQRSDAQGGSSSSYNPWPTPGSAARYPAYPQPYLNPTQPRPPVYPAGYTSYAYPMPRPYYPAAMPSAPYGGYYPLPAAQGNPWMWQPRPTAPPR